jgi:hypothetical protein
MATDTPLSTRNLVIYEIYVRSHSPEGSFAAVEADLPRIRAMGVNVVWFMPVHPVGQVNRKGSRGSPYAIADYREINPEYGSKEDFQRLVERAHQLGLRVMIDVVFNHTSPDSVLARQHPDWFYQDENGQPVTTVPSWSDVVDLKHPNPALSAYLIDTLKMWSGLGVDGFRCDVASLLPLEFWLQARREVAAVRPGALWLAESVHARWVGQRRAEGLPMLSDGELYQAFDLTYDYDIWPVWQAAASGRAPVNSFLEALRIQDCSYPANFVKLRCVENHDQLRIMALAPSPDQARAWTAFSAFNKGAWLVYAGLESGAERTPSLFEAEPVAWGDYRLQEFVARLASLKKHPAVREGQFVLLEAEPAIQAAWITPQGGLYGVFNVAGAPGQASLRLADGAYPDLLEGVALEVLGGLADLLVSAAVVEFEGSIDANPVPSLLLDGFSG